MANHAQDSDVEASASSPLLGTPSANHVRDALGDEDASLPARQRRRRVVQGGVIVFLIVGVFAVVLLEGGRHRQSGSSAQWPTYVGFEGPTPTGSEAFAAATGYPQNHDESPLSPPASLSSKPAFNVLHMFGNLSPWASVDHGLGTAPNIPEGCTIEQVHLLHRHGARYPTSDSGTARMAARLTEAKGWKAKGPLRFLNEFRYRLGAEILTPFGREQLFNLGISYRVKYGQLLEPETGKKRSKPVFRTESQDRMLKSALNFASGFFGIPFEDQYHQLITIEAWRYNNTLAPYMTCPNGNRADLNLGPEKMREWIGIYLRKALPRLQAHMSGLTLTLGDLYNFQLLAAYETVALGASKFTDLFTGKFAYSVDLQFWYTYSFGHPVQAALGKGWVQEWLARITMTPITVFDSTTNSSYHTPEYFPLKDQRIFVDATHDTVISAIITTLGFSSLASAGPLPSTHIPANRTFEVFKISPFAANLASQILSCPSRKEQRYVRWLLNDGIVPLETVPGCGRDKDGLCSLEAFVDATRRTVEDIDFHHDCYDDYPLGEKPIVNGRPSS